MNGLGEREAAQEADNAIASDRELRRVGRVIVGELIRQSGRGLALESFAAGHLQLHGTVDLWAMVRAVAGTLQPPAPHG